MAGATSRITVEIGGKLAASLAASLRAAQAQVSSFSRNVNRTFNDAATAGAKGFKGMLRNDAFQAAAAGAASIGLALGQSVRVAARFEQSLTEIGKTAQLTRGQTNALGADILRMTTETNQSSDELSRGFKALVGQGLDINLASKSLRGVGRVATATQSDIEDVSRTTYQLVQNLKVLPEQTEKAFDILAYSSKQGAFELKDMAKEFPKVATSAQKLGIVGLKGTASLGAMLQVVGRGASDSSAAANNLLNLMEKITAQDAVKNFKKNFGVDIEKVVKDAQKKGLNPLEESIKVIQKLTKGDSFALNKLFGDMQVKAALAPLLKDFKDYEQIRDQALNANGVIDEDYRKQLDTFTGRMKSFSVAIDRLGITIGNASLPSLTRIAQAPTPVMDGFAKFASDHPRITAGIVGVGAAFVGLVAAAPFIASFIEVLAALKLAIASTSLGAAIAGWAGAIGPAIAAIGAAVTGPVGIAVLAVIGLGLAFKAAYDKVGWFRDGVNSAVSGIGQAFSALGGMIGRVAQALWAGGLGQMIQGIQTVLQGVANVARGLWHVIVGIFTGNSQLAVQGVNTAFAGLRGIFSGLATYASGAFNLIKTAGAMAWNHIRTTAVSAFQGIVAFIRSVPAMVMGVGQAIIDTIINGIKARASALVAAVKGVFANVRKMMPFSDAKEGPFKYLTASGKAIITTLADGVGEASPRLHGAIHAAAQHGMKGVAKAQQGYDPQQQTPGQPQLTAAGVPLISQPFIPQYPARPTAPQPQGGGLLSGVMGMLQQLNPLDVPTPTPAMAMAGGGGFGGMSMNPTVNINVAGTNASAEDIADQVRFAFQDLLGQAESGVRAFLND